LMPRSRFLSSLLSIYRHLILAFVCKNYGRDCYMYRIFPHNLVGVEYNTDKGV
jgi:hypothetical protein